MADLTDPAAVDAIVGAVVDRTTEGLNAAVTDSEARQADLAAARKRTGNRMRTDELEAAIAAEGVLVADARALAERTTELEQEMTDDLARLVALAFGRD
jgi:hypothetical protein